MSFAAPGGLCAQTALRFMQGAGEYSFDICQDGLWQISADSLVTQKSTTLAANAVNAANTFQVEATVYGSKQLLSINRRPVGSAQDTQFAQTSVITLGVISGNPGGTVTLSNFVYAPLQ